MKNLHDETDWSSLSINDPRRGQTREFHVTTVISNLDANIAVIECDDYSTYTCATRVAYLVGAALGAWRSDSYLLCIRPRPHLVTPITNLPIGWTKLACDKGVLVVFVDRFVKTELKMFFDTFGDREEWLFALPRKDPVSVHLPSLTRLRFPEVLIDAGRWEFVISISLDDMLMGFMQAGTEFDEFSRRLKSGSSH